MRKLLAALAALALVAPLEALAETCTKSTTTTVRWGAATDALWTGCTPDATDDFVIAAGRVETSGSFTVASLSVNGGTFVGGPGTTLTVTSFGRLVSGVLDGRGIVRTKSRVRGVTITGGATPNTVVTLQGSVASSASIGDFLVVLDDDPADLDASIRQPLQIGGGDPQPGKYRVSPEKWRWYPITAVSGSTVTISTDPFADVETSLPIGGTSAYSGTRGPALPTPAAATNVGPLGERLYSQLDIDIETAGGATVVEDGDLGDQFVEFTSGPCTGYRAAIDYVDASAATTADKIFIAGDSSACGASPNIRIHMGLANGDPVAIVRPWQYRGNDAAHFEWGGGTLRLKWARFVRLDDQAAAQDATALGLSAVNWRSNCNFCVYRRERVEPEWSRSYIEDSEIGYTVTNGSADTAALGFVNLQDSATPTAFATIGGLADATGFRVRRLYVHDQADNASGVGIHGYWIEGYRGLDLAQVRISRLGDDGVFQTGMDVGGGRAHDNTNRHLVVEALLSPGSNSQQCFNASAWDAGGSGLTSEVWVQRGAVKLTDASLRSCDDGALDSQTLGAEYARIVTAGSAGKGATAQPGVRIGLFGSYTNLPADYAIEDAPNVLRSSLVSIIGPTGVVANSVVIGGKLLDSVVYGGELMTATSAYVSNATEIARSFVSLGVSTNGSSMLNRYTAASTVYASRLLSIKDSVLLRTRTGAYLCTQMDPGAGGTNPVTSFAVERGFFGVSTIRANGLLADCMTNAPLTDAMQFRANGLTIASVTPDANGLGRVSVGAGTFEGFRVENALVEATSAPTAATAYGARATATSHHAYAIAPDTGTGAPISAYVDPSSVRLPHRVGLSELGTEQALAGDLFLAQPQLWTTDETLLEALGL